MQAFEFTVKRDLDADNVVGFTVDDLVFDKQYDASGYYIKTLVSAVISTIPLERLLLSLNSLVVGDDLRYSNPSTSTSSSEGPSLLILKDSFGFNYSILQSKVFFL